MQSEGSMENIFSVHSIHFMTDDQETISLFLGESIHYIDEEENVTLQIPVFADGRSSHLYVSSNTVSALLKNSIIKEATQWALSSRLMNYRPRN
jgi:hypothetical protein